MVLRGLSEMWGIELGSAACKSYSEIEFEMFWETDILTRSFIYLVASETCVLPTTVDHSTSLEHSSE